MTVSCDDQSNKKKLEHLQGYWSIDTVEKPDGSEKEFPFTNHMDFFNVEGTSGTKSRVSPTYDGRFISYGDAVKFVWVNDENQLVLKFADGENSYSQTLKKATEDELILIHEDGTIYNYKSYDPDAQ
ncbi:hypothetical protein NMS_1912 [Nonlabens marinus S1-08]|uniref:Lipocalin-like domain-containing protein n=2 Tax=Nonlabens TaxID=363408 RepID=W8W092_9FLAO|nr:hypothetical protein NMS_1912 [Nonlabens marinus S1-08]